MCKLSYPTEGRYCKASDSSWPWSLISSPVINSTLIFLNGNVRTFGTPTPNFMQFDGSFSNALAERTINKCVIFKWYFIYAIKTRSISIRGIFIGFRLMCGGEGYAQWLLSVIVWRTITIDECLFCIVKMPIYEQMFRE